MILVPKPSEFITLSILAFIHDNCLLHCIYLSIVCLALGNSVPKPLFEDFQDQALKESEVFSEQQGKCPCSLCTYYFSYLICSM
jgi:hypothetical protein